MSNGWTDKRLDDFSVHIEHRFDAIDRRFDAVDQRFDGVDQRFDGVDRRLDAMDRRFEGLETQIQAGFGLIETRFDGLHRTLLQSSVLLTAALLGVIATQL